jgi:hypothetical protein
MITDPELLRQFEVHHLFLQSCRVPMKFEENFPASIFVFDTKEPQNRKFGWDFRDNLMTMFISCRVGKVGFVATLQDGGAQELCDTLHCKLLPHFLHPFQFQEVVSRHLYLSHLANRTPKYLITEDGTYRVFQQPLGGLSSKPFFLDWDLSEFSQVFSAVTGVPVERLFYPPDKVASWLLLPGGSVRNLSFEEFPWPPGSRSAA